MEPSKDGRHSRSKGDQGSSQKSQGKPRNQGRRRRRKRKGGPGGGSGGGGGVGGGRPGQRKIRFSCQACGKEEEVLQPSDSMDYTFCRECYDKL